MKTRVLRFGSLTSPLARSQSQAFIDSVHEEIPGLSSQLTLLPDEVDGEDTQNEVFTATSQSQVRRLAGMLTSGQIDAVVLEAADLPLVPPEGTDILCSPPRVTPFDAYLNRQGQIMDEMEPGSRVGIMSARARAQMQHLWPDINFQLMHGGIDRAMETHLRHSEIDGLVLPAAATEHLGIQGIVAEIYAPDFILPGSGQGTLVVLGRAGDQESREALRPLHCPATEVEITAEMAFRRRMISDMDIPVGVLAQVQGDEVIITGSTGACINRVSVNGPVAQAEEVGLGLAQQILSSGEALVDLLEADFPDGLPPEDEEILDSAEDDLDLEEDLDLEDDPLDAEIAALDEDDDFSDPDEYRP